MTTQNFVTLPREVVEQALNALTIADNIALVGSAYTPKSIDSGFGKIRDAAEELRAALTEQVQPAQVQVREGCTQYVEAAQPAQGLNLLWKATHPDKLIEPVNCDTCRYHHKEADQTPCNTCIHSRDFENNFKPRFEITKGQQ